LSKFTCDTLLKGSITLSDSLKDISLQFVHRFPTDPPIAPPEAVAFREILTELLGYIGVCSYLLASHHAAKQLTPPTVLLNCNTAVPFLKSVPHGEIGRPYHAPANSSPLYRLLVQPQ
jgi:hypothetical protein